MSEETEPVFPVAGWTAGTIPRVEAFMLRFEFLTHAGQHASEANTGRYYALTAPQLRELIPVLQRGLQQLESAGPQAPPGRAN